MMRAYRIRVYGKPRKHIDPHQFVQALIMLARELHDQQLQEQASRQASQPEPEPEPCDGG